MLFWLLLLKFACEILVGHQELCVDNVYKPLFNPLSEEIVNFINMRRTTWKADKTTRFPTKESLISTLGVLQKPRHFKLPILDRSLENVSLPKSFDSREKWPNCPSISEIRDQSNCGSCWAFGAVEAMTDRICIHGHNKAHVRLSAEDLVSCCKSCGFGCFGGWPVNAWKYWKEEGIVTGGAYHTHKGCIDYAFPKCEHHSIGPYPPCNVSYNTPKCVRKCQKGYGVSYKNDKHYGKDIFVLKSKQENIMYEIMQNGPVEASFVVYADFPSYKSGVYQHVAGGAVGGHAIRIIGWGIEHKTPYWLIANSWNPTWGDKGYFKIKRGSNECNIEEEVVTGIPVY